MKKLTSLFITIFISIVVFSQEAKDFYKEAKKLSKEKKFDLAIDKCNKAIQKDANLTDAYLLRGEALVNLNKKEEAVSDLKKAAAEFKRKKSVQLITANTLFDLKRFKESILYYEIVYDIDDDNMEAIEKLYKAAYYSSNLEKAKKFNSKAIEEQDEAAKHYFFQGLIAHKQKNYVLSEKALVDCAKLNNKYPKVYTELTRVRIDKKLYSKAVATADYAIKNDKNDDKAYYLKAQAQSTQNDFSAAAQTLTDLLNVGPKDEVKAHFERGEYYFNNSEFDLARKDYTFALKRNPNLMMALDKRATIYEKQNDVVLASNDYKSIVKLDAKDDKERKIIENAKYRIYELNKEKNAPEIVLVSHKPDDKDFIEVKSNQPKQTFKIQIKDQSKIKSIVINDEQIKHDAEAINPLVELEKDVTTFEHLRIDVTDEYLNKSAKNYHIKLKKIAPPKIALTEPYASTNGETYIDKDVKDLFVEGKIKHSEKVKSVLVNGVAASFLHDKMNPVFSAKIDVTNLSTFNIEVEGEFGTKTTKNYNLVRTEVSEDNPMGKTWVVFIENSNYQNFSSLEGPTKDINLIKTSLGDYSISKIIHKKDMNKSDLDKFFAIELRDLIKKNRVNSLMVWYAGHGKFVNETGYWIPTDAKRDEEYSYYNINTLRASMQSYDKILVHNLVITDACESGPSFYLAMRDAPEERVCGDWEATKFRSAQVLSSAGRELAADNSQFTETFATMLKQNPDDCIPIEKISNKVVKAVVQAGNQKPSLGKIKGLQDQNGTFFFIKRK